MLENNFFWSLFHPFVWRLMYLLLFQAPQKGYSVYVGFTVKCTRLTGESDHNLLPNRVCNWTRGLFCFLNCVKTWAALLSVLKLNYRFRPRRCSKHRLSAAGLTQFSVLPVTILLVLCNYIFNSSRASNRQGSEKSRRLLCLLCYCKYSHSITV